MEFQEKLLLRFTDLNKPHDFITKTLQGSIDWIASQGFLEGPYSIIVAHKDQLSMKLLGPSCTMLGLTIFLGTPYHYGILPHTNKIWIILILKSSEDLALIRWLK